MKTISIILKTFSVLVLLLASTVSTMAQTAEEEAEHLRNWKIDNTKKYKEAHDQGVMATSIGAVAFVQGIALTAGGAALIKSSGGLDSENPDIAKHISGILLVALGPVNIIVGVSMLISGGVAIRRAHNIKIKAKKRGVELTYNPIIMPATNNYGMHLSLTF